MSRSVTFNGVTRFRPGGITRISTERTTPSGIGANVVAIIGEADRGAPGSVEIIRMSDPDRASRIFGLNDDMTTAVKLAFAGSAGRDPRVPGGASEVLVYKTNNSTQASAVLPSTVNMLSPMFNGLPLEVDTGATTSAIPVDGASFQTDEFADKWVVLIIGGAFVARKIQSNNATTLTLTAALPTAPAAGTALFIVDDAISFKTLEYGTHTNTATVSISHTGVAGVFEQQLTSSVEGNAQVYQKIGAYPYFVVEYTGGGTTVSTTINTATVTRTVVPVTTTLSAGAHAGHYAKIAGKLFPVLSNTTSDATLVYPMDEDTYGAVISGEDSISFTAIKDDECIYYFEGSAGKATSFNIANTANSSHNVTVTITDTTTLADVAAAVNSTGVYNAYVYPGKDPNFLAKNMDFYTTGGDAVTDFPASLTTIVSNACSTFLDVSDTPGYVLSNSGNPSGDLKHCNLGLYAQVHELITVVNATSEHLVAERSTVNGGSISPVLVGFSYDTVSGLGTLGFSGGTRGTSSNSSFQAGFDALLGRDVDYIVPLIDADLAAEGHGSTATWDSVAAQLASHIGQANNGTHHERGAFIGYSGTKSKIINKANLFNSMDIQLVPNGVRVLDAVGNLVDKGPKMAAVIAAGMRSGVAEIGEPLTYKYLPVYGLTNHSSWSPSDNTDVNDLIMAGVLFAEENEGQGFRWVRDLTTWTRDDHLAHSEGSVRDVVRKVAFTLRKEIEDEFTGRKATPATIGNIRSFAAVILDRLRDLNAIVDSTDPVTGETIHAWHGLRVISEGDVVYLSVEFFPVPGINFQLDDLRVAIPSQAA